MMPVTGILGAIFKPEYLTDAITNGGEHAFGMVGRTWFNICVKVLIPLIFLNGFGVI